MQIFWLQIPSPCPSDPVVKIQLVQNMVVLLYQFNENHKCNSIVANILPADPAPMVMLHIKFKGMGHRAPCKHIFSPYTLTLNCRLDYNIKLNSECDRVVYKIKGKEV